MSQADDDLPPLLPAEEAAWLGALEAALRPTELSAAVNERLIEQALEDPFAPPTAEELAESARLRDALEHSSPHEDAATLAALRAAFGPAPGDASPQVEAAVARATRRRGNVIYAAFGVAGSALAAAAVVMLLVTATRKAEPGAASAPVSSVELAKPRSAAPLFSDRFETKDTSSRMDIIASARSRDLRDNRFAAWGVR